MTQQQEKKPSVCRKCKENGFDNVLIDFESDGHGGWILLEHVSKEKHNHRKSCNECGNPIMYNPHTGKYDNAVAPFDNHNCRNEPERYKKEGLVQNVKSEEPEKLDTKSINTIQDTNPIQKAVESSTDKLPSGIEKRIELMWTVIKSINEKTDKIASIEKTLENLIESINKYFEKTDKDIANLAGAHFQKGSELQQQQPSEDEIKKIMEQEEEPTKEDDYIPPSNN